jgi:hypothetical protein
MLVIKQTEQGYKVKHLFAEYSNVEYDSYAKAIDLCRLRSHKTIDNDVTIIKVPFRNMWLVDKKNK